MSEQDPKSRDDAREEARRKLMGRAMVIGLLALTALYAVVTYLGMEDVDGAPTHALHVALKNGDSQTWYLDPDAWLAVRVSTRTRQRGVESVTDTDFGDYEKVAGVYFPFEQESGPQGSMHRQRITVEQVVVNGAFDKHQFTQPSGPEKGTAK